MLKIFNSLSKDKKDFTPLSKGVVSMYVCGPTVYDYLHIGNFRGAIFFNVVYNHLMSLGYEVKYAYNYTDVDDKILKKAKDSGKNPLDISSYYISEFEKDFKLLELRKPTYNPRVSEHIENIISLITQIIESGYGYEVDGHVYFDVASFKDYGSLSGKKIDENMTGLRKHIDNSLKKSDNDFVLWKPSEQNVLGWDSPWGRGRPGWHIECTAMIKSLLGDVIDIHGGGIDLLFPHHENEIAQGGCLNQGAYANYWMHNQFINMEGQKMAKSQGNVVTGRDFMKEYHPEVLKHLVLKTHYRSVVNFSQETILSSIVELGKIYKGLDKALSGVKGGGIDKEIEEMVDKLSLDNLNLLNDDFNTSGVISNIFQIMKKFSQKEYSKQTGEFVYNSVKKMGASLSLFQQEPSSLLKSFDEIMIRLNNIDTETVEQLIHQRNVFRSSKDYVKSDELRSELSLMGIVIYDNKDSTTWSIDYDFKGKSSWLNYKIERAIRDGEDMEHLLVDAIDYIKQNSLKFDNKDDLISVGVRALAGRAVDVQSGILNILIENVEEESHLDKVASIIICSLGTGVEVSSLNLDKFLSPLNSNRKTFPSNWAKLIRVLRKN